jgi:hypothetical protein
MHTWREFSLEANDGAFFDVCKCASLLFCFLIEKIVPIVPVPSRPETQV